MGQRENPLSRGTIAWFLGARKKFSDSDDKPGGRPVLRGLRARFDSLSLPHMGIKQVIGRKRGSNSCGFNGRDRRVLVVVFLFLLASGDTIWQASLVDMSWDGTGTSQRTRLTIVWFACLLACLLACCIWRRWNSFLTRHRYPCRAVWFPEDCSDYEKKIEVINLSH